MAAEAPALCPCSKQKETLHAATVHCHRDPAGCGALSILPQGRAAVRAVDRHRKLPSDPALHRRHRALAGRGGGRGARRDPARHAARRRPRTGRAGGGDPRPHHRHPVPAHLPHLLDGRRSLRRRDGTTTAQAHLLELGGHRGRFRWRRPPGYLGERRRFAGLDRRLRPRPRPGTPDRRRLPDDSPRRQGRAPAPRTRRTSPRRTTWWWRGPCRCTRHGPRCPAHRVDRAPSSAASLLQLPLGVLRAEPEQRG